MQYYGNQEILQEEKTAFLCSRKVPPEIILRSYDWARAQRDADTCVICGNHSVIEQDVVDLLLRGSQPLVLVLARSLKKQWPQPLQNALEQSRLLIISPFGPEVKRASRRTAAIRNQEIIRLSNKIVVGHASPGGQLAALLEGRHYQRL